MSTKIKTLREQAEELFSKDKYNEVIALLSDEQLEIHNDKSLYAWRARAHNRLRDGDLGLFYAQKAIDKNQNYWMGYLGRGRSWAGKGDHDNAIADYTKAIELEPNNAYPFFNRGISWGEKGDHDKAIVDYNKAIELKPDFALAFFNRGISWGEKGDHDKAITDYTTSIELQPDLAYSLIFRGISWGEKGDHDKAIVDYNKAIELKPDFALAFFGKGIALDEKGEYNNAIDAYKRYLTFTEDKKDYWSKRAKSKIDELKLLAGNKKLSEISRVIKDIKKLLLFERGCITHYTSLSVARILLLEGGIFRISEGAYLNDTSEGRELLNFLNVKFIQGKTNETIAEVFVRKPFIGSFVEETLHDDLNLWRMNGKEDKEEAKGCALYSSS